MFALIDLNQPYLYTHMQRTDVLSVKIPSNTLTAPLKDPHRYSAIARTGQSGTGRITAEFLSSFFDRLSELSEDTAYRYASRIVDLVTVFLEAGDDVSDDHPIDFSNRQASWTVPPFCCRFLYYAIEIIVTDRVIELAPRW
jgi:hypothetical protein